MKNLMINLFILLSGCSALAGSTDCTNVTHVTSAGDYHAARTDCVISIEKTTFEPTVVYLPASSEFTVRDATSYSLDDCENYGTEESPVMVCNPAGVTVRSEDSPSVTIDGSESTTLAGYYYQDTPTRQSVKFNLNGSNWDATYSLY